MRHRIFGRQLGRDTNERKRLFRNLSRSLILHGRITTTLGKAKALKPFVERLITYAKENTLSNRRLLLRKLPDKEAVNKLLLEIGPLFKKRAGGYTRIIRSGSRLGDNTTKVILSFTENVPASSYYAKNKTNKEK